MCLLNSKVATREEEEEEERENCLCFTGTNMADNVKQTGGNTKKSTTTQRRGSIMRKKWIY